MSVSAQALHSTRDRSQQASSKEAILQGIATDGGLFVHPSWLKAQDIDSPFNFNISNFLERSYEENALEIMHAHFPEFEKEQLASAIKSAYSDSFSAQEICPVTQIGSDYLLELFWGPTCAFKDLALQMLPYFLSWSRPEGQNICVVVATSGDTGKAALEGFSDVEGTSCLVLYPHNKVSDAQRLQMLTQRGSNVDVCAVKGNFDDCQRLAKQILLQAKDQRKGAQYRYSSANSINIGRLISQISYYFDAAAQLMRTGKLRAQEKLNVCVPTGNFGDILAGYLAKKMGAPLDRLIVAANQNCVLVDFIESGIYDARRDFVSTISPSMDILISSNVERLIWLASDGDSELVSYLMNELAEKSFYKLPQSVHENIKKSFAADWANEEQTKVAISTSWREKQRLIDPHTAVAVHVAEQYKQKKASSTPMLILSTASPFKFSRACLEALNAPTYASDFNCMDELAKLSGCMLPTQLSELRSLELLHTSVKEIEQVPDWVSSRAQDFAEKKV